MHRLRTVPKQPLLRTDYVVQHCAFNVPFGGQAYEHKWSHGGTGMGSVPQPVPVQLYRPGRDDRLNAETTYLAYRTLAVWY